jgi:hypothetical protein
MGANLLQDVNSRDTRPTFEITDARKTELSPSISIIDWPRILHKQLILFEMTINHVLKVGCAPFSPWPPSSATSILLDSI